MVLAGHVGAGFAGVFFAGVVQTKRHGQLHAVAGIAAGDERGTGHQTHHDLDGGDIQRLDWRGQLALLPWRRFGQPDSALRRDAAVHADHVSGDLHLAAGSAQLRFAAKPGTRGAQAVALARPHSRHGGAKCARWGAGGERIWSRARHQSGRPADVAHAPGYAGDG